MITEKTKDLFKFIDFLHSNIDNFKQYDEVTNELNQLDKERDTLTPDKNFKDKITFDEVQDKIKDKFQVIEQNIMQPIKLKATELKICDQTKEYFRLNFDLAEIDKTKKEFNKQDLSEILAYKNKYIEFKTETKSTVWQKFFFVDFEKTLSILFDYFNENKLSFIDEIKKYTTKKNQSSISDAQKNEIDKKYFPNGFFYKVKTFDFIIYSNSKRFDEPFESLQEYEKAVKNLRHRNALSFFHFIKNMNEADFIKEINNQYLDYTLENTENAEYWLKLTYDLVLKGFSVAGKIEDINLRGAFINWYNEKIKSIDIKQPQQNEIFKPLKNPHNPIILLKDNSDLFKDLELFPDVKCDLVEVIDNIMNSYTKSFIENCKTEITTNLYLKKEPNIFFIRELERTLNTTNASIQRIDLKFKDYSHITIEKYGREISLQRYFAMAITNFKDLYSFAKSRIKEINEILKQKSNQFPDNIITNIKQPQQTETQRPDEVKKELHSDIFTNNGFDIWQNMFDKFKIKKSSYSTDIDFMFNVMKKDGLINEFVGNKNMLDWISKVYEITFEKIRYTNHKASSNEKRYIIYNEIISK